MRDRPGSRLHLSRTPHVSATSTSAAPRSSVEARVGRRAATLGALGALLAPPLAGCAALIGEEDIDAWFLLIPRSDGSFFGWTEFTLSSAPGPDDEAVLRRVVLQAPPETGDLSFLLQVAGEAVREAQRTLLVTGGSFPPDDSLGLLDVVHEGGLRGFFLGDTLRIEWTGQIDPAFPVPPDGIRIDATVTIEVL
jgi:hypothetical protein